MLVLYVMGPQLSVPKDQSEANGKLLSYQCSGCRLIVYNEYIVSLLIYPDACILI